MYRAILDARRLTARESAVTDRALRATLDAYVVTAPTRQERLLSLAPDVTSCAPIADTDARPMPSPGPSIATGPAIIPMRSAGTSAFAQRVRDVAASAPTSATTRTAHGSCVAWLASRDLLEPRGDMANNQTVGDGPSIRIDATTHVACDQDGQSLMKVSMQTSRNAFPPMFFGPSFSDVTSWPGHLHLARRPRIACHDRIGGPQGDAFG
jgi:hypothetical protein